MFPIRQVTEFIGNLKIAMYDMEGGAFIGLSAKSSIICAACGGRLSHFPNSVLDSDRASCIDFGWTSWLYAVYDL